MSAQFMAMNRIPPYRAATAISSSLNDVIFRIPFHSSRSSSCCNVLSSTTCSPLFQPFSSISCGAVHSSSVSSSSSPSARSFLSSSAFSCVTNFCRSFSVRPSKSKTRKSAKNSKSSEESKEATAASTTTAAADDVNNDDAEDDSPETLDAGAARVEKSAGVEEKAEAAAKLAKKKEKREQGRLERELRKEERLKAKEEGTAAPSMTKKESLKVKYKSLMHKIKKYPPRTNGIRNKITIDRSELSKERPILLLTKGRRKTGGRAKSGPTKGKITVRHRGGGPRLLNRFIDFKRNQVDEEATVIRLEYDPTRTAYIALLRYPDGLLTYIVAPQDLSPGDVIMSSRTKVLETKVGNAMPLAFIPNGTTIHNIEMRPKCGGQLVRAAGTSAKVIDKVAKPGYVLVELSSREQRFILATCMATVGTVSNPLHGVEQLGKAGRNRWKGRRPIVRANAMNPVDHPMGGGFNAKGRHPCGPTGILSKGFKTRRNLNPLVFVHRTTAKQTARA